MTVRAYKVLSRKKSTNWKKKKKTERKDRFYYIVQTYDMHILRKKIVYKFIFE